MALTESYWLSFIGRDGPVTGNVLVEDGVVTYGAPVFMHTRRAGFGGGFRGRPFRVLESWVRNKKGALIVQLCLALTLVACRSAEGTIRAMWIEQPVEVREVGGMCAADSEGLQTCEPILEELPTQCWLTLVTKGERLRNVEVPCDDTFWSVQEGDHYSVETP